MNKKIFFYSGCAMILCMLGFMPVANAQQKVGQGNPVAAQNRNAQKPMGEPQIKAKAESTTNTKKTNVQATFNTVLENSGATMYETSKNKEVKIRSIVDGYDKDGENLEDSNIVKKIFDDVQKITTLVPTTSLELRSAKDLSAAAKAKMEQMYGKEDYTKTLQAEAEKAYPMVNLKEKVTVNYSKGPKHFRVSGTLYRITPIAVTIDDTVIDFVDLEDTERAKFDKQWNKYLREQYVESHRARLIRQRAEETQTIYDQLKFNLFKKNEQAGFLYLPESDNWTNAREYTKIYINALLKKKAAEKEAAEKAAAQQAAQQKQQGANEAAGGENADQPEHQEHVDRSADNGEENADVNKVMIEDTEENQEQYQAVLEKFEEGKKELAESSGIDAYPAYKKALWGFDIEEVRFSLWKEPEFKSIQSALGRDTIQGNNITAENGWLKASSIDLVYDSSVLCKVVYNFENTSRTEFQEFKDTLTEQFGKIKEDKSGNYLGSIFSAKQEAPIVVSEDEQEKLREGLDEAKTKLDELQQAYDEADDDTKEAAESALKKAQSAVKSLEKKVQAAETSAIGKEYEYIATRMDFKKNDKGSTVLPYMITWKGAKTTGTIYFYYNKQSDQVENIYFVKEVN